jgi:hypothetical protein
MTKNVPCSDKFRARNRGFPLPFLDGDLWKGYLMPTSQNEEQPGDEKRESDVPQPVPQKPAIREMEKKPEAREPEPSQPPEAL